jgi:hypothetical protein
MQFDAETAISNAAIVARIKRRQELEEDIPAQLRDSPRPTVYELARQKSYAKIKCYPAPILIIILDDAQCIDP